MISKLLRVCLMVVSSAMLAWAAGSASIRGMVLDASGRPIMGADVTVTGAASSTAVRTKSGPDGAFSVDGLASGQYRVTVDMKGFQTFAQQVTLQDGQQTMVNAKLVLETMVQSVEVNEKENAPGTTMQPTQQQVFESNQSVRVLDRKQMDAAGPVAGAAQVLAYAPGTNVTGYGNTGATKYTIMLNGINQGWGGYGGYTASGALGITFDGVPIADPATNLWQSPTIPETNMLQNVSVTYGPGDPMNRWYNNIGGGVEFTPVQPTTSPKLDLIMSYGSYNQKDLTFNFSTGLYHGWSTVISGGVQDGDSFRQGPDGFNSPSQDGAIFVKSVKTFQAGSFEVGGYYVKSGGYRAQVIPLSAAAGVTMDGQPGSPIYSQETSGFYSTLAYNNYNKYDTNMMGLVYARENVKLDDTTTLHNLTWYMDLNRFHRRLNDAYSPGPQLNEWNNPYTNAIGDKVWVEKVLPFNTLDIGAYYIHAQYDSRNNFYNPADGGSGPEGIANPGGKIRSSYFNQDDAAFFAQDDISPVSILHITPGMRFDTFQTGFYNGAPQDFALAPGAVLSTSCRYLPGSGSPGTVNVQGACPASNVRRSGVEPSIDVSLQPIRWLTIYGGYDEILRTPQVGGGGGLFQSVDPASYHLAQGAYSQAGVKVHFNQVGPFRNLLVGAAYYHLDYSRQEIDTTLENGDTISANGSSAYRGVNAFFDADPINNLHVFANINVEGASYSNYQVGCTGTGIGSLTGCTSYNNIPVSYVPSSTVNSGAYYDIERGDRILLEPGLWYQFTGTQHIFNNELGAPSSQTMPNYGTVNMSLKLPFKFMDFDLNMLNLTNKKYNIYEYISSGGYFGSPTGGYTLAYPAAPFTVYGSMEFHFDHFHL